VSQDLTVTVSRAQPTVFAILADPTRLSVWVSDITDVSRDMAADRPAMLEESFVLRLGDRAAVGEIISYEPPWSVAYRLTTTDSSHVLRGQLHYVRRRRHPGAHPPGERRGPRYRPARSESHVARPGPDEASAPGRRLAAPRDGFLTGRSGVAYR
jgi:uncharacterized protein YndB with AHSA1/START domain